MIIGFDLDDVLLRFQDTMRAYYNATYNTNYTKEHDKIWNLWERWNCSQEESVKRLQDFFDHDSHHNALPLPGSIEAVKILKKDNTLLIISAKPENLRQKTVEWLDRHFPNMFEELIFTRPHFDPQKRRKSEVCKELGVEIFIEDALHNAHDVASVNIPVLLLDMPWNQNQVLPPLVTRVFSWPEIVEKIGR